MKKFVLLGSMLVMLFSFTLTANAEVSPKGTPVTSESTGKTPGTNVSPKTGEDQTLLFGLGAAAVVFASGVIITGKKVKEA